MVIVAFKYDEKSCKWEPSVHGVKDQTEAKQAFNFVVLTCRDVFLCLEHGVKESYCQVSIEGECYALTPKVTTEGLI
jgi:hypothetical protein